VGGEYELNFIEIEKKIIFSSKSEDFNETQLEYELLFYTRRFLKNTELFNLIEKEIRKSICDLNTYSQEQEFMQNFLKKNFNILNFANIKEACPKLFTSQLITNWILLSFNTNLIDKSYFENKEIYFNRYECIDKFTNYFNLYLLYYDKNHNETLKSIKEIKHVAFTIFNILEKEKILLKFLKKFKIKKKKITGVRTHIFYKLKNFSLYDNEINFNIFLKKPTIKLINKDYFIGGIHYSTFFKIFKANNRSNKKFDLSNINLINKLCSLPYQIDFDFYENVKNLIYNELNLKKDVNLKEWLISNLNNHYNKGLYNEIEEESVEDIESKKKIYQQIYSKYLLYYVFNELKEKFSNINEFYLAISFDFRGRIYPKSCVSPAGHKIFRYLYYYGFYTEKELKNLNLNPINIEIKQILINSFLFKIYDKIDLSNIIDLHYSYWCIFEIGKIFKNQLSLKKNGKFSDKDLLVFACDMTNQIIDGSLELSFEEKLEYQYIISGLKNLNERKYKKLIIYKDATASGIQLLTIILGAQNEEILQNCNLKSSDYWYDTYFYIIRLFIQKNKKEINDLIVKDQFDIYINRKSLKSSIMTYVYGAGENTALNYYLDTLPISCDKTIGTKVFKIFYTFLSDLFKSNNFFKTPLKSLVITGKEKYKQSKEIFIITTDKSKIFLDYNYITTYRLDRIIKNERSTIIFTKLTEFPDNLKTWTSLIANVTQGLDALFVRLIISDMNYPIITIHDCFGIDILNISHLIEIANLSINKISYTFEHSIDQLNVDNLPKDYYSKYILF
jgi:hypothetical protein